MTAIQNILVICSDQHRRDVMGCSGNSLIETPNLDALARSGTRFARAYCNAPICVPSRASLATGLPIHEVPSWDNADPYHGQRRSYMHRLRETGYETVSIGKLHYRSTDDDNGYDTELLPMHVVGGTGTFYSLLRDPVPRILAGSATLRNAGHGETEYTNYDNDIAQAAVDWITARGQGTKKGPFLLNVSFVNPHPPYVAPKSLFDTYVARALPHPTEADWALHPSLDGIRQYFDTEAPIPEAVHHSVIAAYYANVALLDRNIGRVLTALEDAELRENTLILYVSDHGDTLGEAGLYGKCSMFEGSVGIPMILSGPGVPSGRVCQTATQLLDVYPTVLAAAKVPPDEADCLRRGTSLFDVAGSHDSDRWVLIQDHCAGSVSATFALTNGQLKYVHHLDFEPMLFDLERDPLERDDRVRDVSHRTTCEALRQRIYEIVDPLAINAACRRSQNERANAQGGFEGIMSKVRRTSHTPPPGKPVT